jgi:hypothetical protein
MPVLVQSQEHQLWWPQALSLSQQLMLKIKELPEVLALLLPT